MTLDQWHAKVIENDDRIQRLRGEMEEALAEMETLFHAQPSITPVDDAASQSEAG
jgi:hypothetical protein